MKRIIYLSFGIMFVFASCDSKKTSTTEEVEITTMDSTSKLLQKNTEQLEDQTNKLENSLEKLDKEFETKN
ncbi:MAG: hypothetical protein H0U44_02990 [Flavisolibacter sp.]|jgi:predicted RNase H-like nuclease (RuvC/YqgF family)|nr:hypothetical protein [Flavisolibacter sp.]